MQPFVVVVAVVIDSTHDNDYDNERSRSWDFRGKAPGIAALPVLTLTPAAPNAIGAALSRADGEPAGKPALPLLAATHSGGLPCGRGLAD